jgi:hypothetical protein
MILERVAKILGGNFGARIFFLHIPKCGGISLYHSIRACYNPLDRLRGMRFLDVDATYRAAKVLNPAANPFTATEDYEILKLTEPLLLYFMSEKGSKFIAGHFSFSEPAYRAFQSEFAFLTLVRDPVKRWISHYFYNKRFTRTISMELKEFIKTDYARSQGFDIVKYIGGASADGDYSSPRAIERAKKNLDKFHIVGVLEYLDDFAAKFRARFGVDLKLRTLNESPVSAGERDAAMTEEIRKEIEEICRPDLEVYRYAVEKFIKR